MYTLDVKPSQIVGVMGQSGSGKSTLLDLIAGFLEATSGNITFENRELTTLHVENRPITILFQNYNIFEHLSVLKNVLLGINSSFSPKQEDINEAKEILKEVGLEGFEDKIATSLSGGQAQRVALARCLIRKKSILLLDEPFTGLDVKTRQIMLKLVKDITKKRELCTIMVTHEKSDCELIADKIYEVVDGEIKS